MTDARADQLLTGIFTDSEKRFLFAHAEFAAALRNSDESDIAELNEKGVQILLSGGYFPRSPEWNQGQSN